MLWLLAIAPLLAGTLIGAFVPAAAGRRLLALTAAGAMLITLALAAGAVADQWSGQWVFNRQLVLAARLDPVSTVMVLLVPAVALPVVIFAAAHEARAGLVRLIALLTGFVGAMELLVMADDLLTLLIGWELVGACSWGLIAHQWRDQGPPRDAAAAFLITRFGDLGLFLAAMVTYAATGSLSFAALGTLEGGNLGLAVGGLLLAAAAKSAQLPFSLWLFNAMAGPSSASALLHAATMVAAGAYLLARLHPVLDQVSWFAPTVMALGLATALAGGLVAVVQPQVKKLLAASTSAHYGFMFVAVGAGYPGVAVLHLVVHAWFKALVFMAAGVVSEARHSHLLALLGQGQRLPVVAMLAGVGTAALAGIPPLGGAWTKELVGAAAGHHGPWLALGVLLAGGLSAAYAVRWQWLALGPEAFMGAAPRKPPGRAVPLALAIPAGLTLASALVWLPPVHQAAGQWFHTALPSPPGWEKVTALLLVGAGAYVGAWLARNAPDLGRQGPAAAVADWLGLPGLLHRRVVEPGWALALAAARFDDGVLHRAATATGNVARRSSHVLGRADTRVVEAAVRNVAGAAEGLAAWSATMAEAVAHGVVRGTARTIGAAGLDATRLETGLAHHYLTWVIAGAAAFIVIALATS